MAATGYTKLGPIPKTHVAADQGQYFTFTNPTPGTGIISGAVTSLADTTPLLLIKNNNQVALGSPSLYLDYLKLVVSVVGIGHTAPFIALKVDRSQTSNRYTSGGSTLTPQAAGSGAPNVNGNGLVYFGAITAAAAGNAALLASHRVKGAIEVVLDSYTFDFGAGEQQPQNGLVDNTTTISHALFNMPPVVIAPQEWLAIHYWGGSMSTGTTFFVNGGYIEA
jgi:hypothetical protein